MSMRAMASSTAASMAVGDGVGRTGEGQHAPVVVASDVRSSRCTPATALTPRCDGIDDVESPTLAEVGDALDELGHGWASV